MLCHGKLRHCVQIVVSEIKLGFREFLLVQEYSQNMLNPPPLVSTSGSTYYDLTDHDRIGIRDCSSWWRRLPFFDWHNRHQSWRSGSSANRCRPDCSDGRNVGIGPQGSYSCRLAAAKLSFCQKPGLAFKGSLRSYGSETICTRLRSLLRSVSFRAQVVSARNETWYVSG